MRAKLKIFFFCGIILTISDIPIHHAQTTSENSNNHLLQQTSVNSENQQQRIYVPEIQQSTNSNQQVQVQHHQLNDFHPNEMDHLLSAQQQEDRHKVHHQEYQRPDSHNVQSQSMAEMLQPVQSQPNLNSQQAQSSPVPVVQAQIVPQQPAQQVHQNQPQQIQNQQMQQHQQSQLMQQPQPHQTQQPQQMQPIQQQIQSGQPQQVQPQQQQQNPPVNLLQYHGQSQPSIPSNQQPQQQQRQQQVPPITHPSPPASPPAPSPQPIALSSYHDHSNSPLYIGHNPYIEILRPKSYADDNIVTLNLSHSHIYEIDSDAFVGQRFEHIDLSNNKLGLIHSRSFRIGPNHSRHSAYGSGNNTNQVTPPRRPPPAHPKGLIIDFSNNPAIVALSGAFEHIDVPNCLLNFTNSTVELKFGAFKKYLKEHPGHMIDIASVDCCEQEWLLGYKHNFVARTRCEHDPSLYLSKVSQQTIIDSCISYVTSGRRSMTIQGPSLIQVAAAAPKHHSNSNADNPNLTYLILGGTAMILTSLSIYIIFYMFSLKAAFVYQMQLKS